MNFSQEKKSLFSNMLIMLSALLSAILLMVSILYASQVTSWFKAKLVVENPAKISNFITKVEYSTDGSTWKSLATGEPILVTTSNVDNVRIRVGYQGFSAAYVRVSLFGGFYNKNTGTYLPQSQNFWAFDSNSTWKSSGGYMYYPKLLEKKNSMEMLAELGIDADLGALGSISSHQEYEGKLYVIVDAVQPDRYQAHWGISALPF